MSKIERYITNKVHIISLELDDVLRIVFGGPINDFEKGISLSHTFTVTESFDQPNGKFGDNLGNAVVIDCQYIDDYYSAAMLEEYPLMSLL